MSDTPLRIRVGAAIDASFTTVFRSLVDTAKKAQKTIADSAKTASKEAAKAHAEGAKSTEGQFKQVGTAAEVLAAKIAAGGKKGEQAFKDLAKAAEDVRPKVATMAREIEREMARIERANARAMIGAGGGGGRGGPPGYGSIGGVWYNRNPMKNDALLVRGASAAMHAGRRLAGDVLHGMGVDTTLQGQLHGSVEREKIAAAISTGAYIPGNEGYKGPAGSEKQIDPKEIVRMATTTANATGNTTEDILEGMDKFVMMTGDLKTIKDSMMDIGKIAKANGTPFEEMALIAKDISVAMGDVENKGPALAAIMKTIAGQGHMGSVTFREQGKNMALLTAQANFFKADPRWQKDLARVGVTQETTQRVAVMGAMQQLARAYGGRTSGRQASQSALAFIRDAYSASEMKRMKAAGLTTLNEDNTVRDPMQIVLEVMRKASKNGTVKGHLDPRVTSQLIPNKNAAAFFNAMSQGYNQVYDTAKGTNEERHAQALKSVAEKFEQFLLVTQSSEEVMRKFETHMDTTASKVNVMNNQFGAATDELKNALLPALPALTKGIIELTGAVGGAISFITGATGQKQQAGELAAGRNAQAAGIDISRGIAAGQVSPEEMKRMEDAKAELDAKVKAKEAEVASYEGAGGTAKSAAIGYASRVFDYSPVGYGYNKLIGAATGDSSIGYGSSGLGSKFRESRNENAARAALELKQLKEDQAKATAAAHDLHLAMMNGNVKVQAIIVEDRTKTNGAEPHTDGTSPPDAPTE